jgi:hypothetical protein
MNPLFQLPSFYIGILLSLIYIQFKDERINADLPNSRSSTTFAVQIIYQYAFLRYTLYALGIGMMIGSIIWQTPFTGRPSEQSAIDSALYATFSFPAFTIGLCMILLPSLTGKAYLFRFVFAS